MMFAQGPRAVLSHSRKGYSEAVWRQTSESFIRCLENAFRYFGCQRAGKTS
jgi:transposase